MSIKPVMLGKVYPKDGKESTSATLKNKKTKTPLITSFAKLPPLKGKPEPLKKQSKKS